MTTSFRPKELMERLANCAKECSENDNLQGNLELSYAETKYILRLIKTDNYNTELALENLKEARDLNETRKMKEQSKEAN